MSNQTLEDRARLVAALEQLVVTEGWRQFQAFLHASELHQVREIEKCVEPHLLLRYAGALHTLRAVAAWADREIVTFRQDVDLERSRRESAKRDR